MRIPEALQVRLAKNPYRKPNEYTLWGTGRQAQRLLNRTFCKRCGVALTAIAPDPRFPPLNRELAGTKERTIIQTVMVSRQRTPEYDTIEYEVEEPNEEFIPEEGETQEGSEPRRGVHRAAICKKCRVELIDGVDDLADVQLLYEADLENMALADQASNVAESQTYEVLGRLAARKVVRILR